MQRINALIFLFAVTLTIPLCVLIVKTYSGLKQEEIAQLRFFATELFSQMEDDLAATIYREEARPVDAYQMGTTQPGTLFTEPAKQNRDAFTSAPQERYILGYFQNNPDGTLQIPPKEFTASLDNAPLSSERLKAINTIFNRKKYRVPDRRIPAKRQPDKVMKQAEAKGGFEEKFIKSTSQRQKSYLGKKERRTEEITVGQAANLAQRAMSKKKDVAMADEARLEVQDAAPAAFNEKTTLGAVVQENLLSGDSDVKSQVGRGNASLLTVEVTPFQAVAIDADTLFVFRRVILHNQVYRQGFVLAIKPLIAYLADRFFLSQPMAAFTRLSFARSDKGDKDMPVAQFGVSGIASEFRLDQTFPPPFEFLRAELTCHTIPLSTARTTLNRLVLVLFVVVLLGFFAIYKSVRSVVDLAERRSRFVASVTHELKTPLTNISLYIEMLEQGIARDKTKEQAYYQILSSESARLNRLIGNVLELSRLEKKQRAFNLQEGKFTEVIDEVHALFAARLEQENYALTLKAPAARPFVYDREVMVQVLVNLIENSLKFGKQAALREIVLEIRQAEKETHISIGDHGPGIPSKSLRKIFDDFYRGRSADIQAVAGTGIGLALVKKFITAMGGRVKAANRSDGPGCVITLTLPS